MTHSAHSFYAGFAYIPAVVYKLEYTINKFAYALTPSDPVHWASWFPPSWAPDCAPMRRAGYAC